MISLELHHRGDSNGYTQYIILTLVNPKSAAMEFFQGTQERVRNSHGNEPSVFQPLKVYYIYNKKLVYLFMILIMYMSQSLKFRA